MSNLSKYLTRKEYQCPCCNGVPYALESNVAYKVLFDTFDVIREKLGKPILVTSEYRCPKHNAKVGGSPLSIHMFGLALDMDCKNSNAVGKLFEVIESVDSDLRMGTYRKNSSFVHIDMGYLISPRVLASWRKGARWKD